MMNDPWEISNELLTDWLHFIDECEADKRKPMQDTIPYQLINRAADALRVLCYTGQLDDFPHALHQFIRDYDQFILSQIKRPADFPHHKWESADLRQRYMITGQNVKNVLDTVINVIDNPNAQNQFMVAYCIGNLRSEPIEGLR
jgi:hypothetical protein